MRLSFHLAAIGICLGLAHTAQAQRVRPVHQDPIPAKSQTPVANNPVTVSNRPLPARSVPYPSLLPTRNSPAATGTVSVRPPAQAQPPTSPLAVVAHPVDPQLQQRVEFLERELNRLKQQVAIPQPALLMERVGADRAAESKTINMSSDAKDKPAKKEAPVYPTIKVAGFFQADAGWIHQSPANFATVRDVQDGADFRRARLSAAGKVWDNVSYFMEYDFAFPGRPSFMDVYLDIHEIPLLGNLRIGHFRQPFGMDALTSVKELTFLERSLPFALTPFRQIGVGFYNHGPDELTTWSASGFRYPTDVFGDNVGDNGGYGTAARVTGLLLYDECCNQVLHVGANGSWVDSSVDLSRFLSPPEFFVGGLPAAFAIASGVNPIFPPFVDTGFIPTNSITFLGAELAASYRSLHFQSEWIHTSVNQVGGGTAEFSSGYAQVGYILTGEYRPYNRTSGVFGRIKPHQNFGFRGGGFGAWEIAGRASYIELNDGAIQGGRLTDFTAGLNWYLNAHTKFQFNYIYARLNRAPVGRSDAGIAALRAQVDF